MKLEQLPAYDMVDFNTSYEFKIAGLTSFAGMSIYNVFDNVVKTQGDQLWLLLVIWKNI